ncbi:transmembrane protein [Perilla frutescens var. frutescens]|nr:transmembrane protein [Perilla frutescens var. frutescens]
MIGEEEEVGNLRELYKLFKKIRLMEQKQVALVVVPLGIGVLMLYHIWLILTIKRNPRRTVIGLNAESRRIWVSCMMDDPLKNGVLAIQTIRNNIMASTVLATVAITLSSLISVYVNNESSSSSSLSSVKFSAVLVCFLAAFLCNVLSIRYYAHTSFLVTVPVFRDRKDAIEHVATNLNRGGLFWSLGLRAFYLSFPLFLWVFGPIPMFLCCCVMSFILYFLDTTTNFTRDLYNHSVIDDQDLESAAAVQPA